MHYGSDEPLYHDYKDEEAPLFDKYAEDGKALRTAIYDYTPAGALMLQYEKDEAFTAILRDTVPTGFMSYSRKPFAWVIDYEYADDVLEACRKFFDYVEHGDIE